MTNPRPHPNVLLARRVAGPAALAALLLLTAGCTAPTIERGDPDGSPSASTGSPAPSSSSPAPTPGSTLTPTEPPPAPEVTPTSTAPAVGQRTPVSVATTYSGWSAADGVVMVGGFVEGVVESDGRCTLTLTGPGTPASVSATALPDAGSTSCGELRSKVDASGTWTATVTYESSTSAGTAPAVTVVVP